MLKFWMVVQTVVHGVLFWRMLARHAAREYRLLEQVRQMGLQVADCMAKLTFHQYQHQQMLTLLQPTAPPGEIDPVDSGESGAERFRDHPTPPGRA